MRALHVVGLGFCAASILASGCASVAERSPAADKIAVYQGLPPDARKYRLVKRVWTESWQSAFEVPRYASAAEGAADLQGQAVALGGDAIMNFGCYRLDPEADGKSSPRLICNANVIRFES